MNKKGLESFILCHLMSVCAQFLSLGDDWSIHLKRSKVVGVLIVPKFSLLLAYRLQNFLTQMGIKGKCLKKCIKPC
jgi:hypothetical protein